MSRFRTRHAGLRWTLYYGSYEDETQFAVDELQAFAQRHLPYVIECRPASEPGNTDPEHRILIGTPGDNRLLADLIAAGRFEAPTGAGGYSIAVLPGAKADEPNTIAIAGFDPKGTLNGAVEMCARAANRNELCELTTHDQRLAFDSLGIFNPRSMAFHERRSSAPLVCNEAPAIEHRGIWTWGYVIYDYQRFLDNMARLKMNMLVMWNDCPPLNSPAIIAHARKRGIAVIAGFHWGWGIPNLSLTNPDHLREVKEQVIARYERQYRHLGFAGIYFQTATEHTDLALDGKTIAAAACDWVNDIGRALLERNPELLIQFGLHATSIMGNYADLRPLDPRIQIVWEDAGVTPYSYTPCLKLPPESHLGKQGVGTFDGTLDYSRKLAAFRGEAGFGICPKGWSNLDWGKEFENHLGFILGRHAHGWIRRRLEEKKNWWTHVNRDWIPCYGAAARFYAEIRKVCRGPITAVGLVEDGMFEAAIQPSVAIFAQTLWNPDRAAEELMYLGCSPYYQDI